MQNQELADIVSALDHDIDQSLEVVSVEGIIKMRSRSSQSRVLLILSQPMAHEGTLYFRLLKHRSLELTNQFKDKAVRRDWIVDFSKINAKEVQGLDDITYLNVPSDCEILKKSDVKIVVRDKFGTTVTAWKDGAPQVSLAGFDGTRTRNWERHVLGVTNWYYDSVRF